MMSKTLNMFCKTQKKSNRFKFSNRGLTIQIKVNFVCCKMDDSKIWFFQNICWCGKYLCNGHLSWAPCIQCQTTNDSMTDHGKSYSPRTIRNVDVNMSVLGSEEKGKQFLWIRCISAFRFKLLAPENLKHDVK